MRASMHVRSKASQDACSTIDNHNIDDDDDNNNNASTVPEAASHQDCVFVG